MSNREQGSPDEMTTQNELICEELLHWKPTQRGWLKNDGYMYGGCGTPSFTTWAEAGLILDALAARGAEPTLEFNDDKWNCYGGYPEESFFYAYGEDGPVAIRAAALEYIEVIS